MAKYRIRYIESYQKWYEVEADNPKEAEEKLLDAIADGFEDGPEECYDSGCEEIKEI